MHRRIGLLPGIAILAIVYVHANGFGINALLWWSHRYQSLLPLDYDPIKTPQYFIMIFLKQALLFGVPAFLFVSGFFTSYAIDKSSGNIKWRTIRTRLIAILIPYLIWTFIDLLLKAGIGNIYTPGKYLLIILSGLYGGYFFVTVLIMFYLLSPLLISMAKRNWKLLLVFSGSLQVLYIALAFTLFSFNSSEPVKDFFLSGQKYYLIFNWFFYFPFGIVFGLYLPKFKQWLSRYWKSVMVICIILLFSSYSITIWKNVYIKYPEDWIAGLVHLIIQIYCAGTIIVIIGFAEAKNLFSKPLIKLGGFSLGIYLTHLLFITYFAKIVYHLFPSLLYFQFLFIPILFIIGLGSSLLLMMIVRKTSLKRFYPYLFG